MKNGIFIIGCLLEPPFGGISKYLSFSLPKISTSIPIYGITQRGYPNNGNKEIDLPNFKLKLIKNNYLSFLLLPLYTLLHYDFFVNLFLTHKVPIKETLKTIYFWLPETDKYLKKHKDNIKYIHVYDKPSSAGAVGMYLSKKYNIPLLITTFGELVPHKDEIERLDDFSKKFEKITRSVLNHAHKISSPTKYCQSILNEYNIPLSKVFLTYHVCDIEKFGNNENKHSSILTKYTQLHGKRCVLFVGQMLKRKAPDLILKAANEIKELDPDVIFVFIGPDYGLYPELRLLSKEFNLEKQCLFPGAVSDEELLEFYSFAEIFVFTTVSKIECLGLVFVQAMLSNCAVIASNISGVPEVIKHNRNGLLFTPGNYNELSSHLTMLLNDESKRKELILNGKLDVLKQFDEKIVLNQITDFYN